MSTPTVGSITPPSSVPQAIPFSPDSRTESLEERIKDFKTYFFKELSELYPNRDVSLYKFDERNNLVNLPTNPKDASELVKRFKASYDLLMVKHSSREQEHAQATSLIETHFRESIARGESLGSLPSSRAPSTTQFDMEL